MISSWTDERCGTGRDARCERSPAGDPPSPADSRPGSSRRRPRSSASEGFLRAPSTFTVIAFQLRAARARERRTSRSRRRRGDRCRSDANADPSFSSGRRSSRCCRTWSGGPSSRSARRCEGTRASTGPCSPTATGSSSAGSRRRTAGTPTPTDEVDRSSSDAAARPRRRSRAEDRAPRAVPSAVGVAPPPARGTVVHDVRSAHAFDGYSGVKSTPLYRTTLAYGANSPVRTTALASAVISFSSWWDTDDSAAVRSRMRRASTIWGLDSLAIV